jgi:DNA-binding NarL/FixJ family response regulator
VPHTVYSVVIADDDEMIRWALGALLDHHPSLTVLGSVNNGCRAAEICGRLRPTLAILDVMMDGGGIDGLTQVAAASPATAVVFYTAQADRRTRQKLLDAGAAAVFAKGAPIDLAAELLAIVALDDITQPEG